jgi:hypothetical protein
MSAISVVNEVELELLSVFGSSVADETRAVLTNVVPAGVPLGTCMTNVKVALEAGVNVAIVHVIVPPSPTAGTELQSKAGPLF